MGKTVMGWTGRQRIVFFLSFSCVFSCSQVRARNYDSAQLSRADSLKAVARPCSLLIEVSDALVM